MMVSVAVVLLMLALMLPLLALAAYVPDPPLKATVGAEEQVVSVTDEALGVIFVGQAPSALPVRFTATLALDVPSVTVTFCGLVVAAELGVRCTVNVPPEKGGTMRRLPVS